MKIGFIGLGTMGLPMAQCLTRRGHDLLGRDTNPRCLDNFNDRADSIEAKACHNMICGITALGVCESFALAAALGLDLQRFFELCSGAAAQSWILRSIAAPAITVDTEADSPIPGDYSMIGFGKAALRHRPVSQVVRLFNSYSSVSRSEI